MVKYKPRQIVINNACIMCLRLPSMRLWCAHVIDTPEASSTDVLRSGTSMGFRGIMPAGGQ